MRALGSLRTVDSTSALVVTACGAYLAFRMDPKKPALLRNLVEIRRSRAHMTPNQEVLVDAYIYARVRKAVVNAIASHRSAMHLPMPLKLVRTRDRQLKFEF